MVDKKEKHTNSESTLQSIVSNIEDSFDNFIIFLIKYRWVFKQKNKKIKPQFHSLLIFFSYSI
mgnify:CR=1 FL=1